MLVDTDVLIWLFRGAESAKQAIDAASPVALSAVTCMELAQGVRDKDELRRLRRTLAEADWRMLPLTPSIGARAIMYIENYALSDGLRFPDALIGATAVESGDRLLTGNSRHYRCIPGLSLLPYLP